MQHFSKNIIIFLSLIMTYLLIAYLDIYHTSGTILPNAVLLFPILSLPLSIFLIKKPVQIGLEFGYHIIIMIGIYLITNNIYSVFIYILSVGAPAHIIAILYKRKMSLPHTIVYGSITIAVIIFLYLNVIKLVGIDYEAAFILLMDEIKIFYLTTLDDMKISTSSISILEISIMKELITTFTDQIKQVYPALILTITLILTSIQGVLVNLLLSEKGKKLHELRILLEFKLSKVAVVLLFIAMLIPAYGYETNDILTIVSLNLVFFLEKLMQIVGMLSITELLRRATIHKFFKATGYIFLGILFLLPSNVLMVFGCLDTLLNYRKAQIIV